MKYLIIPVTNLSQNCSLIWCKQTKFAALIDPGGDEEKIKQEILESEVTLIKILLTHGHLDHVGAAYELAKYYNVPIIGPEKRDEFWLKKLSAQGYVVGSNKYQSLIPDIWLHDGQSISIGELNFQVLHCPGHTPGHVVFFNEKLRFLISGDVIFRGSVGRSDFPGSNQNQLIQSIKNKLLPLGSDVTFIAGHGPMSTLGYEFENNPFLRRESKSIN